jgi:hypothetical protein
MNYRTSVRFLGLPLVHFDQGRVVDGVYRRGMARGWVAVGDVAVGPLVAVGGVSLGGISIGGLAVGFLPVGGLALGVAALGGLAAGALAVGGAAIAWFAAFGGLAVAREYARGGVAVARHANDMVASDYFSAHPFFRTGEWLMDFSSLLVFIPATVGIMALLWRWSRRSADTGDR